MLMGGEMDGKKITVKRDIDFVNFPCFDWVPGTWVFWGDGTLPEQPKFTNYTYKRLTQTHIFYHE